MQIKPAKIDINGSENSRNFQFTLTFIIRQLKDSKIKLSIDNEVVLIAQLQRRVPYHIQGKVALAVKTLVVQGLVEKVPTNQ